MNKKSQTDFQTKWNYYTPQQKEAILTEFRKKHPDDYYCKTTLFAFLSDRLENKGIQSAKK